MTAVVSVLKVNSRHTTALSLCKAPWLAACWGAFYTETDGPPSPGAFYTETGGPPSPGAFYTETDGPPSPVD